MLGIVTVKKVECRLCPVCLAVILLKDEELARYLSMTNGNCFLLLLRYYTDYCWL